MFKKIKSLTKIFIKDFYKNIKIINKETNKLNVKSILFWILVILFVTILYISYEAINFLKLQGIPELFLYGYLSFLLFLIIFQITTICANIFFFSKDLEFILPLPIKTYEMLIAKFNTILFIVYITELLFAVIPLTMFGIMNNMFFDYFLILIILLILAPIFFCAIISMISLCLMRLFGFIRNKTILQNLITIILFVFIFFLEDYFMGSTERLKNSIENIINPIVETLINRNFIDNFKFISNIFIADAISFILFYVIGIKTYLKNILNGINNAKKSKKIKKFKYKKQRTSLSYIAKELRILFRSPTFFVGTTLSVIIVLISAIIIINNIIPALEKTMKSDENITTLMQNIEINSELIFVFLGINQFLFSLSSIAATSISREGKNVIFIKYIPVSLYKQFKYKVSIQIIFNIIVSIIAFSLIYNLVPRIGITNIILLFIASIFINFINSYLMLIADLRKPMLNWNSEHSAIKKDETKSFQYAITIIMFLFFMYLSNILKDIDLTIAIIIECIIFMIIFIIIDRITKNKINILFNKIP